MQRFTYLIFILSLFSYTQELSHNVFFDTDNYEVSKNEERRLNSFISSLDSLTIKTITINGYCDDRGTAIYNLS